MKRAGGRKSKTFSGEAIHPPPGERIIPPTSFNSAVSARSSCRKAYSPRSPKIWATVIPSRRSISRSRSRKGLPRAVATPSPTVVFPEPGSPTRTTWGRSASIGETGCDVRNVAIVVPPRFVERVAAELLEESVSEDDGEHRLGDHPHRRGRGDVAPLGGRLGGGPGRDVHRLQGAHEGADRLHRHSDDEGLAGGHPAFETTRAICAAPHVPRQRSVGAFDLVVDLGPGAARGIEADSDLDPLHRGDRHHRRTNAPVQLPVPRDVRPEPDGKPIGDDLADAA